MPQKLYESWSPLSGMIFFTLYSETLFHSSVYYFSPEKKTNRMPYTYICEHTHVDIYTDNEIDYKALAHRLTGPKVLAGHLGEQLMWFQSKCCSP